MKIRESAISLLLTLSLPTLIAEVGSSSVPFAAKTAAAQTDPVTEVARQRYEEGVKAFDSGRFEDARTAFLQAYALKRHPAVLLNLGQSELRSNHPEDGGNHLTQFLREMPSASPDQKAAAEKGISEAKKKTGFIVVIADANGAQLSIDGNAVGKTPLLDPVFVKPGKHTVSATYQNKSATVQVDAKQGSAAAANLVLGIPGAALPPPPPPPPTGPKPTPAPPTPAPPTPAPPTPPPPAPPVTSQPTPPVGSTPPPAAYPPVDQQPIITPGPTDGTPPDQGVVGKREPIFSWYKRKPIAWAGTGVAGLGLGLGIGFSIATSMASSSAEKHANEIRTFAKDDPKTNFGKIAPCGSQDKSGSDVAGYEEACDMLREDLADHDTDIALAATGWALFGLGTVGTVVYAMIDWYPKKQPATAQGPKITAIAPVVGPKQAGIGILGSF